MKLAFWAYNLLTTVLLVSISPFFGAFALVSGKHRDSIRQRLGCYPRQPVKSARSHRIWIHAASVGEVRVAAAIIRSLAHMLPDADIILSTITGQGQRFARADLGAEIRCIYAPIDWFLSVKKAFAALQPDILVCLETEIWPNLLQEAHRTGVRIALINGRISDRSIKRYLFIRPFMRNILEHVNAFSMIRDKDAQRIRKLGAAPERIMVNGNAKYDLLLSQSDDQTKTHITSLYRLKQNQPVFIAGSTRRQEDDIVLDVYRQIIKSFPDTLLIIAPRHVFKSRQIQIAVSEKGLECQLRTALDSPGAQRTAPIVILDTIGELQATYSIASVVFCGGSLVPLGGQNVLEAAVWGKPVLYGPSMEDFQDAKKLLDKTGGGIQVADKDQLEKEVLALLANPTKAERIGDRARQAVFFNKGAAHKHAVVISNLLSENR
ncbi:3-deoxy-D-manno-octulosonic acid transferase [Thermodesulfobacteriota bacterium]